MITLSNPFQGALVVLLLAALTPRLPAAAQAPDTNEVAQRYSLYFEHFKNGNYADALPGLRWSLKNAPASPYNDDRNYKRGTITYDSLAARADDPAVRRAHLDAALALFDDALATLPALGAKIDVFKWTLDKGRFIQTHLNDLADRIDEALDAYRRAYELAPQRLDPYYIDLILRHDLSRENYGAALERLYDLEQHRGGEPAVQDLLRKYDPVIPLEVQDVFWSQKFEEAPGDLDIARRLLDIKVELGDWEAVRMIAEKVLQTEPSLELRLLLARIYLEDGDYAPALALYEQVLEMPDVEPSAEIYYNMGFAES